VWVPTVSSGIFDQTNNTGTLGVARRISDVSTGLSLGVVLIEIRYSAIEQELKSLTEANFDGAHYAILDANNQYVFSDQPDLLEQASAIELREEHSFDGLDQAGNEALIVHNKSTVTGWSLVGTYPVEALVKDARQILKVTIWIAIAAAVIAILLSFFMVRMI